MARPFWWACLTSHGPRQLHTQPATHSGWAQPLGPKPALAASASSLCQHGVGGACGGRPHTLSFALQLAQPTRPTPIEAATVGACGKTTPHVDLCALHRPPDKLRCLKAAISNQQMQANAR